MRTILAGVAMMMLGTPVLAQTAPGNAAATPPKDEAKICKRIEQTGSRVSSKRVCHTADEWQAIDAASATGNGGSNLRSKSN